jgi:hypothetical protein
MESVINRKGYVIRKDGVDPSLLSDIRNELTVKPFINPNSPGYKDVEPYPVYYESKQRLYLPRFYGLAKLGPPNGGVVFPDVEHRPRLVTTMTLRDYQRPIIDKTLGVFHDTNVGGGLLAL